MQRVGVLQVCEMNVQVYGRAPSEEGKAEGFFSLFFLNAI